MKKFIVEYLTTSRHGGLMDKVAIVRAENANDARAKFEAKHPGVAVGFVGLDDDDFSAQQVAA